MDHKSFSIRGLLVFLMGFGCNLKTGPQVLEVSSNQITELGFGKLSRTQMPPELRDTISASLASKDRLLLVTRRGVAFSTSVTRPQERTQIANDALVAAWSTSGDLIAVLRSQTGTGTRKPQLDIRDATNHVLWSQALPITEPDVELGVDVNRWGFRLSWSSDDALLAVSTSPNKMERFPVECAIVRVQDRTVFYEPGIRDVCFLSNQLIAAHRNTELFSPIWFYDLSSEGSDVTLADRNKIERGWIIKASSPKSALIAVWDPYPTLLPQFYRVSGQLKAVDARGRVTETISQNVPRDSIICLGQ